MLSKQLYIVWKFVFRKRYNSFNFIDGTIIRFHWFCPMQCQQNNFSSFLNERYINQQLYNACFINCLRKIDSTIDLFDLIK